MELNPTAVPETAYPFDEQTLLKGVEEMNACGSRTTGSAGHNAFVASIKRQIKEMGVPYKSDLKYFDRWEAKRSAIVIHSAMGEIPVHVSSPFPYSGETGPEGITATPVPIIGKHLNFILAKDKIAVIRVKDFKSVYSGIAFNQKTALPADLRVQKYYKGPVATAFVKFPFLQIARDMGVKAAICIWEDMSDAMVEGQYLNFILDYQGIPALWVNETEGRKVLEACRRKDSITLTLEADDGYVIEDVQINDEPLETSDLEGIAGESYAELDLDSLDSDLEVAVSFAEGEASVDAADDEGAGDRTGDTETGQTDGDGSEAGSEDPEAAGEETGTDAEGADPDGADPDAGSEDADGENAGDDTDADGTEADAAEDDNGDGAGVDSDLSDAGDEDEGTAAGTSPRTGDSFPVTVLLLLAASLTMIGIVVCRRLQSGRQEE